MKDKEKTDDLTKYKKSGGKYQEAFKIKVLEALYLGEESESYIARRLGIPNPSVHGIKRNMLEQYGYIRILDEMKKDQSTDKDKDLAAENAKLKKALEMSLLKVAALETLIDVVDAELNIDIRKKGGSKQSK